MKIAMGDGYRRDRWVKTGLIEMLNRAAGIYLDRSHWTCAARVNAGTKIDMIPCVRIS